MRRIGIAVAVLVGVIAMGVAGAYGHEVAVLDDCDPNDSTWEDIGGCALPKGEVTRAEFDDELLSPDATTVIGHQAWRNDPAYLKIRSRATVHVKNKGGRDHTFTEVAEFGGGIVPPLNVGLTPAPECDNADILPPGASMRLGDLDPGNHRFQCCLHPWMRTLIKVLD